jgi:hypothetical protein
MSTRTIVNCFALVVAVLIGLGVWGWYASDDSRAEVLRLRDERRLEVFCQEYRGVEGLERIYAPVFVPESTSSSVPIDPNVPPTSSEYPYEPVLLVDLERLERNAPSAVEEEVAIVVDADEKMRQTGDPGVFTEPEVKRSVQRITAYGTSRCP